MLTAFQSNAFQNNAFQIDPGGAPAPVAEFVYPHKRRRRRLALIRDGVYIGDDDEVLALARAGFEEINR